MGTELLGLLGSIILIMVGMRLLFGELDSRMAMKRLDLKYFLDFEQRYTYKNMKSTVLLMVFCFLLFGGISIFSGNGLLLLVLFVAIGVVVDIVSGWVFHFYGRFRFKKRIGEAKGVVERLKKEIERPFDPEETGGIVASDDLVPGVTSPKVAELQGRLMDLEYMEEDESRSILISSHISSDLEGLCDDIYIIHEGKIVLHEDMDNLLSEYGLIKADDEQYVRLDKEHILSVRRTPFGYECLTDQKGYYRENYPDIVVENGSLDEAITMMTGGERL